MMEAKRILDSDIDDVVGWAYSLSNESDLNSAFRYLLQVLNDIHQPTLKRVKAGAAITALPLFAQNGEEYSWWTGGYINLALTELSRTMLQTRHRELREVFEDVCAALKKQLSKHDPNEGPHFEEVPDVEIEAIPQHAEHSPLTGAKILIIQSRVKAAAKKAKMRFSDAAVSALSKKVEEIIRDAAARAKANRRQTIKAEDI